MIYPKNITRGDVIGVTAPSDGNKKEVDFRRLDNAKRILESKGYSVIETVNVRSSEKGRSSSAKERASQYESLLMNEKVSLIHATKGGDFLMEFLSQLDFKKVVENPKWFMGYSDNTGLIHTLTTNYHIASIYGNNFKDFGMSDWHVSVENSLRVLEGEEFFQESFPMHEDGFKEYVTGLESYDFDKAVKWINGRDEEYIHMKGRLLGGCLDVLLNLVGTRFDKTVEFVEEYKEDGILWYLESFSLDSESMSRGLWQLKEAGWFQHASGFIFGRPCFFNREYYISYEEAVMSILDELNVPVIFDADIGHKSPQLTIVNGAIGTVISEGGKGRIKIEKK